MKGLRDMIAYNLITFLIAGFHVHILKHSVMMSIIMGMLGSVGYFVYNNMTDEVRNKLEIKIALAIMVILLLLG